MTTSEHWLHRFTVLLACCTFLLVIAGGLVTSTGSGLAVPDWPLSYGQVMPPMVGGIFYEHGHRMVATFVGLLTVIMTVWLLRVEKRKWVKALGLASLFAVILQGVLGGLTVLFLLPTPISVMHATLAQSFFSAVVLLALATSPGWRTVGPEPFEGSRRTRRYALLATGVILLQLVLGAWMRHSDAGLAILDFPLSYGHVLPPSTPSELHAVNVYRLERGFPTVEESQIWIHFAHRCGALLVAFVVSAFVIHVLRTYKDEKRLREPAIVLGVLLIVQIVFGALTIWTGKGVEIATTHVATGALLLATSTFLTARVYHLYSVQETSPAFSTVPQPSRP
jgi:cytochrome c oxidase assembly protein subunit 15